MQNIPISKEEHLAAAIRITIDTCRRGQVRTSIFVFHRLLCQHPETKDYARDISQKMLDGFYKGSLANADQMEDYIKSINL